MRYQFEDSLSLKYYFCFIYLFILLTYSLIPLHIHIFLCFVSYITADKKEKGIKYHL